MTRTGALHHLELWVGDLAVAEREWGWLLGQLGYACADRRRDGQSWRHATAGYVVLEAGPDRSAPHDRLRAGMNHVAFWAGGRTDVDRLAVDGPSHGWRLLFPDRHPYAGGRDHYAAFLENSEGFEIELVAGQ